MNNELEIIKYICEFFFTNFWHYIGLLVLVCVIIGRYFIKIK